MLEARRHQQKLLLSVRATFVGVGGQLPCFRAGEQTIAAMEQRFRNEMSQQQFAKFEGLESEWVPKAFESAPVILV